MFTIGVRASFWYCENDQSLGPTGEGEESKRIGRRCWRSGVRRRADDAVMEAAKRGVRRGLKKTRDAIVKGTFRCRRTMFGDNLS